MRLLQGIGVLLGVSLACAGAETALPASPEPQPQATLPQMLALTWSAGTPMPQGMQDNLASLLDDWLVSAAGFCGGYDDDWKPGTYPRGFLNKAWGFDLAHEEQGWVALPPLPGAPRQAMTGTRVGSALYGWGGFSYEAPYTYADGYRLSRTEAGWTWDALPPLPSPVAWAGTRAVGSTIYCMGGCDYDAQNFYTLTDRTGKIERLGARLIALDTNSLNAGWRALSPCPGTPRGLSATAMVDGKIYYIGGFAVTPAGAYCNVVDSWRYDPASDTWQRLRDLPISGSGTSTGLLVYKDRYILLPCGYQYESVMNPDGSVRPRYGEPSRVARTWENHPKVKGVSYYNHCFVYDTRTDLYGTATALPFDDVATITVIRGETAYMFPGETAGFRWNGEYFGHHPEFILKGAIQELDWERSDATAQH